MLLAELLDVLYACGITEGEVTLRREGQVQISCPLSPWFHEKKTDRKPSLSIGYSDTRSTVWRCFSCGEKGRLWQLVDSLGALRNDPKLIELGEKLVTEDRPTLSMTIANSAKGLREWVKAPKRRLGLNIHTDAVNKKMYPVTMVPQCREYLTKRGIPPSAWNTLNLRYDPKQERMVYPVVDKHGRLVGGVGRTLHDPCPENVQKYKNFFGFESTLAIGGINLFKPTNKRIILVEGYLCLAKGLEWANEVEADLGCCFHGDISEAQADLVEHEGKSVQCWFDNDKTGNLGWGRMQKLLEGRVPTLRRAKLAEGMDVGNMTKNQFMSIFTQTQTAYGLRAK